MKQVVLMSICGVLALCAVSAWADTEVRPATTFEQDYVLRVLTGFDKAVARTPAGWTETDRTEVAAPEHMAVGAAWGPLQVNYRVSWEERKAKAAEAKRREEASRAIEMPDENEMGEISREMEQLSREMALAAQNGDRSAMENLQKKAEQLAARSEAAFASTNAQIRQLQQGGAKNMDIEVLCGANTFDKTLSAPTRQSPVSGLPVYRVTDESEEADIPGTSHVFLGDWKLEEQGDYTMFRVEPRADRIPASVQSIVVSVRAEDGLAREVLESVDWNVLQNLIEK